MRTFVADAFDDWFDGMKSYDGVKVTPRVRTEPLHGTNDFGRNPHLPGTFLFDRWEEGRRRVQQAPAQTEWVFGENEGD